MASDLSVTREITGRTCGPCGRGQHAVCDGPNEWWGNCTCDHTAPIPTSQPMPGVCPSEDCPYPVRAGDENCGNHEAWMT